MRICYKQILVTFYQSDLGFPVKGEVFARIADHSFHESIFFTSKKSGKKYLMANLSHFISIFVHLHVDGNVPLNKFQGSFT